MTTVCFCFFLFSKRSIVSPLYYRYLGGRGQILIVLVHRSLESWGLHRESPFVCGPEVNHKLENFKPDIISGMRLFCRYWDRSNHVLHVRAQWEVRGQKVEGGKLFYGQKFHPSQYACPFAGPFIRDGFYFSIPFNLDLPCDLLWPMNGMCQKW